MSRAISKIWTEGIFPVLQQKGVNALQLSLSTPVADEADRVHLFYVRWYAQADLLERDACIMLLSIGTPFQLWNLKQAILQVFCQSGFSLMTNNMCRVTLCGPTAPGKRRTISLRFVNLEHYDTTTGVRGLEFDLFFFDQLPAHLRCYTQDFLSVMSIKP